MGATDGVDQYIKRNKQLIAAQCIELNFKSRANMPWLMWVYLSLCAMCVWTCLWVSEWICGCACATYSKILYNIMIHLWIWLNIIRFLPPLRWWRSWERSCCVFSVRNWWASASRIHSFHSIPSFPNPNEEREGEIIFRRRKKKINNYIKTSNRLWFQLLCIQN